MLITCLYNFATQVAQGLGVVFPHKNQIAIEVWLADPARYQGWLIAPVPGPSGSVVLEEG